MRHVRGQTQAVVHANCGKIWKDFSFQIQYNAIRISSDWTMWGRLNSGAYKAAPASHRTVSTVPPEIPLNSWLFSSFAHSFSRHLMPTLEPKSLKPACLNSLMKALQVAPCNPQLLQALPFLQHVHIETLKHSKTHYCTGIDWNWIRHSPMS